MSPAKTSKTRRYVGYLRVSTARQGRSGLGLEAQRQAIADFLNGGFEWKQIAEFVEVESGKDDERPKLREALHHAKMTGATLVIAKLDRLSRNVAFIAQLQEAGVKFVCADMPEATELTIHIFAAIAQHERKAISERTRRAMAAAKAKGVVFGNPNGAQALRRAGKGNKKAVRALKDAANARAQNVMPIIENIQASGVTGLRGIAAELNARGILTAREGAWYPATVSKLIARAGRARAR
jgi:DNA invertase Pin-like site-specific DNA recombinase